MGSTINLINETYDFCERREYTFNILSEYSIITLQLENTNLVFFFLIIKFNRTNLMRFAIFIYYYYFLNGLKMVFFFFLVALKWLLRIILVGAKFVVFKGWVKKNPLNLNPYIEGKDHLCGFGFSCPF